MKRKFNLLALSLLGMAMSATAQTENPFDVLDNPSRGVYGTDNRVEAKSK